MTCLVENQSLFRFQRGGGGDGSGGVSWFIRIEVD